MVEKDRERPAAPQHSAGVEYFLNFKAKVDLKRATEALNVIEKSPPDLASLQKIVDLVRQEDIRFLPVIVTSYADDQLGLMFKIELPETIPGGRANLLNGFGPLARFAQRIQIAYALRWLDADVLIELDKLRSIRNQVSHGWDISLIHERLRELVDSKLSASEKVMDGLLGEGLDVPGLSHGFSEGLSIASRFRLRCVWICGLVFLQCRYWPALQKLGLIPRHLIFGHDGRAGLSDDRRVGDVLADCGRHLRETATIALGDDPLRNRGQSSLSYEGNA